MPKTPDYFAGKTIIITGAGERHRPRHGAIFARERANVVCADINESAAREQPRRRSTPAGSQALALKTDVTSRTQVNDMVQRAVDAFGGVQFLFNSAGAAIRRSKFLDIDDALMEKTFDLNLSGTFYAMQAVLPHMLKNKLRRHRQYGEHGAPARRARLLDPLCRGQRRGGDHDHGRGARIRHAGHPRAVDFARARSQTPFQDAAQSSPELVQRFLEDVPMKRFGKPEEIGELVLFMCSDACPFMTADTVYVNGGGGWR